MASADCWLCSSEKYQLPKGRTVIFSKETLEGPGRCPQVLDGFVLSDSGKTEAPL